MDETPKPKGPGVKRTWFWVALIALVALTTVTSLVGKKTPKEGALPPEVSIVEAAAMQEKGSILIDVREPDEWAAAHLAGSKLIPLGELESRLSEIPRDRDIVVVCRSGNRSRQGRELLTAAGFPRVTSMAGGLLAWKEAGRPLVGGP